MRIQTGMKNAIDGKNYALDLEYEQDRVTIEYEMLPGVSSFQYPFHGSYLTTSVFTNGQLYNHTSYNTVYNVGEDRKVIVTHQSKDTTSYTVNKGRVENFYALIKSQSKPLPYNFKLSENYVILNEDIEFPNGITNSTNSSPTFRGSTFKKAPRIYGDLAMDAFVYFPEGAGYANETERESTDRTYAPFLECDNIETTEQQGTLNGRNLKVLGSCNFNFIDQNGYEDLSAYPKVSGEFNGVCAGYINARVTSLSQFPQIFESIGKDCINMIRPFQVNTFIIDTVGTYSFPLMGLDFSKCENLNMLLLDAPNFVIDADYIDNNGNNANIMFTWGHLGIKAPKNAKVVENLHMIFAIFNPYKDEEGKFNEKTLPTLLKDMHYMDASWSKSNFIYNWGASLQEIEESSSEDFDGNFVPLLPSGMEFLKGYYHKNLQGVEGYERLKTIELKEDYTEYRKKRGDWKNRYSRSEVNYFGKMARNLKKNGESYNLIVPPIPEENVNPNLFNLHDYVRNTYAHTLLVFDVTIPAPPSATIDLFNCYTGTFALTDGIERVNAKEKDASDIYTFISVGGNYEATANRSNVKFITANDNLNIIEPYIDKAVNSSLLLAKNSDREGMSELNEKLSDKLYKFSGYSNIIKVAADATNALEDFWSMMTDDNTPTYQSITEALYPSTDTGGVEGRRQINSYQELEQFLEQEAQGIETGLTFNRANVIIDIQSDPTKSYRFMTHVGYRMFYKSALNVENGNIIFQYNNAEKNLNFYKESFLLNGYNEEKNLDIIYETYFEIVEDATHYMDYRKTIDFKENPEWELINYHHTPIRAIFVLHSTGAGSASYEEVKYDPSNILQQLTYRAKDNTSNRGYFDNAFESTRFDYSIREALETKGFLNSSDLMKSDNNGVIDNSLFQQLYGNRTRKVLTKYAIDDDFSTKYSNPAKAYIGKQSSQQVQLSYYIQEFDNPALFNAYKERYDIERSVITLD